jgi:hypothetical protein
MTTGEVVVTLITTVGLAIGRLVYRAYVEREKGNHAEIKVLRRVLVWCLDVGTVVYPLGMLIWAMTWPVSTFTVFTICLNLCFLLYQLISQLMDRYDLRTLAQETALRANVDSSIAHDVQLIVGMLELVLHDGEIQLSPAGQKHMVGLVRTVADLVDLVDASHPDNYRKRLTS